ncbi:epithelial discoidin domain-containing receptor 1-like, partial [Pyrgilauda ruficollis]|uniref:epithelial discoidin domain-containing receptor 1-like n=1 Tax=Pyrgilauda ruficollis TaxID=221976 RepID=UPI001B884195
SLPVLPVPPGWGRGHGGAAAAPPPPAAGRGGRGDPAGDRGDSAGPGLGRSDGDGAWCPAGPVFPAEQEFLEVDLGRLHLVTLVGTQGRHAGGHGREFARQYRLRYSRDRRRWLRWRDRWGDEVIGGNEDPEGVVLKDLSPAPVARALRVYPRAPRAMSVCLRLELYGCPWEAGLLSYTAPRGHVMALDPVPIVLNDSTYDGFSAGP